MRLNKGYIGRQIRQNFVSLHNLLINYIVMKAKKVLFITQEITPYVSESPMSVVGRRLPQKTQEKGREIRTFMPKWGNINERRNQLHEVIRLSGMNLIIDDTDHPLIIKVASIQAARMQVYFIDNDDYFQQRMMAADEEGNEYTDNDQRAIFYARGVLETVKKLRWCPDIIHCHGWMTALIPIYIKTAYREEPWFRDSRVVFSVYEDGFKQSFNDDFLNQLLIKDMTPDLVKDVKLPIDFAELHRLAISYSDGVIQNSAEARPELLEFAKEKGIPTLEYQGEDNYVNSFCDFYDHVWSIGKEEEEEDDDD